MCSQQQKNSRSGSVSGDSQSVAGDSCLKIPRCELGPAHRIQGHQLFAHEDHWDFIVDGRLHHVHDTHCDDHGLLDLIMDFDKEDSSSKLPKS